MGDFVLALLAAHAAAFARADVHGIEELLLAVHALELDEGVGSTCRVGLLVLVALLEDNLCLSLQLFDLVLDLLNRCFFLVPFCIAFLALLLLYLQELDLLVQLLLLDQVLAHLLHVVHVAKVSQAKLDVPHIVLVLVDLFSLRVG